MTTANYMVAEKLEEIVSERSRLPEDLAQDEAERFLRSLRSPRHPDEDFVVTFCGVFSSGKSSLLNALLNYEKFQLPVGINPVTKLITHISYGPELSFSYVHQGKRQFLTRKKFNDLVTGAAALPCRGTDVYITMPVRILASGVTFVDTPGYSDEAELEQMSRAEIFRSDFVVMCASALKLGTMFEREHIRFLGDAVGNFCLVVNRMDGLNTDEDEKNVRDRAAFLMGGLGGDHVRLLSGDSSFFTVASGPHRDLAGFDRFIGRLIDKKFRKNVAVSTDGNVKRYMAAQLAAAADMRTGPLQDRQAKVSAEHAKTLERIRIERDGLVAELQAERDKLVHHFQSICGDKMRTLIDAAGKIERDGKPESFAQLMQAKVRQTLTQLAKSEGVRLPQGGEQLEAALMEAAGRFSVPEPRARTKRVPCTPGEIAAAGTILLPGAVIYALNNLRRGRNALEGLTYVEETVYEGYAEEFRKKVINSLQPQIRQLGEAEIDRQIQASMPTENYGSGLEPELEAIEQELSRWNSILDGLMELVRRL